MAFEKRVRGPELGEDVVVAHHLRVAIKLRRRQLQQQPRSIAELRLEARERPSYRTGNPGGADLRLRFQQVDLGC